VLEAWKPRTEVTDACAGLKDCSRESEEVAAEKM
jgi:hypothetical protein